MIFLPLFSFLSFVQMFVPTGLFFFVKVTSDFCIAKSVGQFSVLLPLDSLLARNTTDHFLLLETLSILGLQNIALLRFIFCLPGCLIGISQIDEDMEGTSVAVTVKTKQTLK